MGSGFAALGAGIGLLAAVVGAAVGAGAASAACGPGELDLRNAGGQIAAFSVEIADTEASRAHGLMFRTAMPAASGMLFIFPAPEHAWFWMKDTLIPLDMIFADKAGVVHVVHANAQPGDLTPVDGGENVAYVLEINGGLAARLGIVPGAEMRSAEMAQGALAWPCK